METEGKGLLTEALNAMEHLLRIFRIERIVHQVLNAVAFSMLLYAIWLVLNRNSREISTTVLVALFGSSGLIAASSGRTTYFFNKAFKLIEDVIRSLIQSGK
jgi:hypothetical protein